MDVEAPQGCKSAHTEPARRTAEHLMLHVDGVGFARRWTIAMALRDHWDGCFVEAQAWIDAGARWFANDPEVALTRGAIYESLAMLPSQAPSPFAASAGQWRRAGMHAVAERKRQLGEARRSLERAVSLDPALDRAQVRLARVLWHLGKGEDGRAGLEAVIARSGDDDVLHLAHLFLARVHQDAGRDEAAARGLSGRRSRCNPTPRPPPWASRMPSAPWASRTRRGTRSKPRWPPPGDLATGRPSGNTGPRTRGRARGMLDALRDELGP